MDGTKPGVPSDPQQLTNKLSRRELLQIACLAGGWAVFSPLAARAADPEELTPAQRGVDASGEFSDPNWKPVFFSDEQNQTMIALCAVMIPATDTPGAKEALVNRYIDLVLSAESPEVQRDYLASLNYVDEQSTKFFKKPFRSLDTQEQIDVLLPMAYPLRAGTWSATISDPGNEHFGRLKGLIAEGYYSSEVGDQELGWDGAFAHGRFTGCEAEEKK